MRCFLTCGLLSSLLAVGLSAADPKPVDLTFEDQFENKPAVATMAGKVLVLVYGDRKGTDACKTLGEQLHVAFHPTAKGLKPAEARTQPVIGLAGLKPGQSAPDVAVIPVACCGKLPALVRTAIRASVKKGSPEVPVWLDFDDTMSKHFGLTKGEPNVVVFDTKGQYRHLITGTPDGKKQTELLGIIQGLRAEAVK